MSVIWDRPRRFGTDPGDLGPTPETVCYLGPTPETRHAWCAGSPAPPSGRSAGIGNTSASPPAAASGGPPRIDGNRPRDLRNEAALPALGWHIDTLWECALMPTTFSYTR